MYTYVALLRGINISGKNKVAMPLLKEVFVAMGFRDVKTYINSGNVIFSSDETDVQELCQRCKERMKACFTLDIPVVIVSQVELSEALQHTPTWWDQESEEEIIHQAIFLISNTTVEQVYQTIGEAKPEYEQVAYYKNIIFWSASRATLSKTRWYKIASSSVNNHVTIRNARTTKKLLSIMME